MIMHRNFLDSTMGVRLSQWFDAILRRPRLRAGLSQYVVSKQRVARSAAGTKST